MPRRRPTPQASADLRQTTHFVAELEPASEVGGGITLTFAAPIRLRQFFSRGPRAGDQLANGEPATIDASND
jgi:hypothetical protein